MLQPADPLQARVESVVLGEQLAHIVVRVAENRLIGTFITRARAVELKLQIGKSVSARITGSDVLFQKD